MARLGRKVGAALLGSMTLAALPSAKAEADIEPNNNTFPGEVTAVGVLTPGALCNPCFEPDVIDFYSFVGLTPGDNFDLTFNAFQTDPGFHLQIGRYTDQTTIVDSALSVTNPVHLLGTVPIGGALSFGVTYAGTFGFEGYSLRLDTTASRVPEPATVVLLGAGLTAMGLGAAHRRRARQ